MFIFMLKSEICHWIMAIIYTFLLKVEELPSCSSYNTLLTVKDVMFNYTAFNVIHTFFFSLKKVSKRCLGKCLY